MTVLRLPVHNCPEPRTDDRIAKTEALASPSTLDARTASAEVIWTAPTSAERIYPPVIIAVSLVGSVLAIVFFENVVIAATAFLIMYAVTGTGLTLGYHRLLCHASFRTHRSVRIALAIAGTMAGQGKFFNWIADHRAHHTSTDGAGDPHSPRWQRSGPTAKWRGLLHAHIGWMFGPRRAQIHKLIPDLTNDSTMRQIDRLSAVIFVAALCLPALTVWALGGSASDAMEASLWGGPVRMLVLNNTVWSINSLGHSQGTQHFASGDQSRNHRILAFLALGDGWHNGHHAFPRSARHGLVDGQWDACYGLIRGLARIGCAWDIHLPGHDAVVRKLAPGCTASPVAGLRVQRHDAAHAEGA